MKSRIWILGVAMCLALGGAWPSFATIYYVNDTNTLGDVYTSAGGNDANSGLATNLPKLTLASVLTNTMLPGDIVYIDTGTNAPVVISNTINGVAGNLITFQGSTNLAYGGTIFSGGGALFTVRGNYLRIKDIRMIGGNYGLEINKAAYCEVEGVHAISNSSQSIRIVGVGANSNAFRRCVAISSSLSAFAMDTSPRGNYIENCVAQSAIGTAYGLGLAGSVTGFVGNIAIGKLALLTGRLPDSGSRNIFFTLNVAADIEALADLQNSSTNWFGNTYADPKFVNADGLDFHLLSAAGYKTNGGGWVTNPAVGYSPAIDFGARSASVGVEPSPNGGRVNVGLSAGTEEASKSNTNTWLFAMTFNDVGTLWQTGRLDWAASTNFGAAGTVDLQYSTNNGASWSNIATVAATNESHLWAPDFSYPAVRWRVVSTVDSAVASTNARPFSVRRTTNTTFTFYVNDGSTANDYYGMGLGSATNDGAAAARPKATLQGIVDAYQLRGGDVVYVDTGSYLGQTTAIGAFDSGTTGMPVRIVGSPNGSTFDRANLSADVLDLTGASNLEIEYLRLTGGRYGLNGGTANVALRNMRFNANANGVNVTGTGHTFDNCVAADNTSAAFLGTGSGMNLWRNGVMWRSPTIISAASNSLSVSNSILVGDGPSAVLFGNQVVPGDYNLTWNAKPSATYQTFSAFQNALLGMGWTRSLYAEPLFADATNGDYHVRSSAGRWDTNLMDFATTDTNVSAAIDLGDPLAAFALELPPNGSRLNAGLYGNTAEASKSRTNAWLQVMSYMDGGTLDAQAGSWLRWNGGGEGYTTSTVTLWLSRDNGATWEATPLATNLPATDGAYWYQNTSTNDSSSQFAMWRVTLDPDETTASQTPVKFDYKNGPYSFYINDSSTNGDVYCTAAGSDTNLGITAGTPMTSLHMVINSNQLGPGDRIYVDTGAYTGTNVVVFTVQDSGSATNPIVIQGSTNRMAGGSLFGRRSGTMDLGFVFQAGVSNVVLRDIVLTNVTRGVAMTNVTGITLENIEVRGGVQRAFDVQGNSRTVALVRCVAHGGGTGVYLQNATNVSLRHCLFWQNSVAGVTVGSSVWGSLQNSILASTNLYATLYLTTAASGFTSDYNGLHAGPLTRVGTYVGATADNLAVWKQLSGGQDLHSIPGDPQMANPGQFDYHLKTEQTLGRLGTNGVWTSDSISSPLLDAGNPASDGSAELPSGNRVNIGRWGGTAEASLAVNSLWLRTASFGDRGVATNGAVPLVWTAGGGVSNETVNVEVSTDGGTSWTNIATGIPATNELVYWNVTNTFADTPAGAWRVTCVENTNVTARSTNFFSIRNAPLNIFVNGLFTNNAVYTKAPGKSDNWMATSNAPLDSVATVFDRFDLEPGDQIWVDTGTYGESSPILIGMKNSGSTSNPVRVTGNSTIPYAGTVLARNNQNPGSYAIQLARANGVQFSCLTVSNAYIGIHAEFSQGLELDRMRVAYCFTNAVYAGDGAQFDMRGIVFAQNQSCGILTRTGSVVRIQNSLFLNNALAGLYLNGGSIELKNSILRASGSRQFVYFKNGGTFVSDYNNIRVSDGANVAGGAVRASDRFLIDWQISTAFANDKNSFGYDPQFADEAAKDYHPKSAYGRWMPGPAVWTNDTETSRLIDLGEPPPGACSDYSNEPTNNGSRINVGLYGNTAEASKSPPPGTGILVPLTLSDGGTVRDTVQLYWSWNGFTGAEYVNVLFSGDGGSSWTYITNHVYINVGSSGQDWNTTNFSSTAMGVWRVELESDTNNYGQTETLFAIKNDPLSYYLNDASTNGDIYCSAIGTSTNTGLTTNSPMNSLSSLLARYKIEHGDTIYVDTGIYPLSSTLAISVPAVAPTNYLVIQGSTNEAAGGSVFTNSSGAVIDLQNVQNVELRDLRLHGGGPGLRFTQSSSNLIWRVWSVGARGNAFELGVESDQNRFIQCAALNFFKTGFHMATPSGSSPKYATNHWVNGVIASVPAASNGTAVATGALVGVQSGRLYLSNSVLVANGPKHDVFSAVQGSIVGDYNVYHRPYADSMFAKTAVSATFGVSLVPIEHFPSWTQWNQSDSNSLIADPLFVDLEGGDLHPQSSEGHYVPADGSFLADADTSPLIDTADPAAAWTNESLPNGQRANVGLYGGTEFASRTSLTNGGFILKTFNQGGIASGVQTLRWIPQGEVFTTAVYTVNIQISTNSGAAGSYQDIGTNLALAGSFDWDTTGYPSLPTIRWRVQCREKLAWTKASERDFAIRNTNLVYYVNDASTNGDVYCSDAGSSSNSGLRSDVPLNSLAAVLARYDLEPGDSVKIDTGNYTGSAVTEAGYLDSGTAVSPVVIQGSTNAQGSVFNAFGVRFRDARGMTLKNIRFQSPSSAGIDIGTSEDIDVEQVDVSGGGAGVLIAASSNVLVRNFSAAWTASNGVLCAASYNARLEFGTIWSNNLAQVRVQDSLSGGGGSTNAFLCVSNCILGSFGIRVPIYYLDGTLHANFNDLYVESGGLVALVPETGFEREFDSVGVWTSSGFGQDAMSLSSDPLFANVLSGEFHLRSAAGRWVPGTGSWTNDLETSPLVDAGDPWLACSEPAPNGARVNLGRYGNTLQASRTPAEGSLTLISYNNGGLASGTNALITWLARGSATNAILTISYSADDGTTWSNLATGIPATNGYWVWDTTLSEPSVQARLMLEGSDGSLAVSEGVFSVRPDASTHFAFYLNDDSQIGDVYCSAKGLTGNSGLSPDKPKADFNDLLAKYDLEGGDIVYIDTGVYQKGADPWRITQADSAGNLGLEPVIFQGSTNSLMNGTVLDRRFNSIGIRADYAVGIRLRNLVVSNTTAMAVAFNDCLDASAEWIAVGLADLGFSLNRGNLLRVEHSLIVNAEDGIITTPGLVTTNTVFPVIEHCVIWNMNGYAVQIPGGSATIQHNLLSATGGKYIYSRGVSATMDADYNSIWLGDSGRVFRMEASPVPLIYDTLGAWAVASGQDLHSFDGDPLLVDSTNWNFHLQSRAGHWDPNLLVWTNDAVSSPLIDMGDRGSAAWTNEQNPNGERVNVGLYGGSAWASKSETNSALHLLTLNRGGVASGQVALNWAVSGVATGHTVRLEVSIDDGATWNLVAEGLAATLEGILWNSASLPSSPLGRWRVSDEVETNVVATSEEVFVIHNGPVYYYVNDEYSDGDVYCEGGAIGDSSNSGLLPNAPKRWVSEIVDTYDLEAGDVIYVDTGYYQPLEPTTFGELDAGGMSQSDSQQINVVGSTNWEAGGSVYIMPDQELNAFHLDHTYGIRFSHLGLMNASNGLYLDNSFHVAGEWLKIQGCVNGIYAKESSNAVITHSVVRDSQAGIQLDSQNFNGSVMQVGSCVLWSNQYGFHLKAGYVDVSNSIFGIVKPNAFGYYLEPSGPAQPISDFNNLYVQPNSGGAAGGIQIGSGSSAQTNVYASVSAWVTGTGQDEHSLAHDPQLADPGNGDFHLKSPGGRYDPEEGWVYTDTVFSPLIDSGSDRSSEWVNEPSPNGERVNIGLHGGTDEASITPLLAGGGWLTIVYPNDGGTVWGDVNLQWNVGGDATNHNVCIDYSPDDGLSWTNIICNWPAISRSYLWDSIPYGRSALGRWRITSQSNATINATNLYRFILRNGGQIPYYVNDSSTNGDVYCAAAGSVTNDGLTTNTPKASLQAIFDTYELSPEDIVYVDAGTYSAGTPPIKIDQTDKGWSNLYVTIQGSTNPTAPTVFSSPTYSAESVFSIEYASYVRLKDLTFRGAQVGVSVDKADGCEFDNVRIEYNRAVGLSLSESFSNRLVRSVLWKNLDAPDGVAATISRGSLAIENSVLWGSPIAISIGLGTLSVTNSVLDASGSAGRIYQFPVGGTQGFHGDYNSYTRRDGALICEQQNPEVGVGNDLYNDMPSWSAATLADRHSMTLDPAFANEVNGDFHPRSKQGRYLNGTWTNDPPQYTNSPLIDAGSMSWPCTGEMDPNGGVVNIGAYGNTPQASLSQTNPPWLRVISYNDGGVMSSNVLLYWLHGGMPSNSPVRLDYSIDAMISWHSIASNVPAGTREYLWDVSTLPLSLGLNWRVVSQNDTNVWDASDQPVLVKTGTYDYYVNDGGPTNLDVFCTGPGLPQGAGANPTNRAFPINSLSALLTYYPVGAGDRVYVDTGTYNVYLGNSIVIDDQNTGTLDSPLKLYGSTNYAAGGTLILGNGTVNGFAIQNTRYIELHDFRVRGAQHGLSLLNAAAIAMTGMEVFENRTNGLWVSGCSGISLRNARIWGNLQLGYYSIGSRGGEVIQNATIWGNRRGACSTTLGLTVSNSILGVTNAAPIYVEESKTSLISGDYNMYGMTPNSIICSNLYEKANYVDLRKWQEKDRDWRSFVVADPLFVNSAAGNFHLQSRAGYWDNGSWPTSTWTSWAIDAGPSGTNEPSPNGGRINLGAYGGTPQASLSDSSVPEFLLTSLSDGGIAPDGQPLYWLYRGIASTNLVSLYYSRNNGDSWVLINNGIGIDAVPYEWFTSENPSPEALWRVVLESNTNIYGQTTNAFILKPVPLIYYVNDGDQTGDIYTEAVGSSANWGYESNSPLDSIQAVLDRYPLSGGDEIRVDTGVYSLSEPVRVSVFCSGDTTNRVYFIGSTNWAAGGTRMQPSGSPTNPAFLFFAGHDVDLSNFHLAGFTNGVSFAESSSRCTLSDLDIQGSTGVGVEVSGSDLIRLQRVLIREGNAYGVRMSSGLFTLDSCVIWSNQASAIFMGLGAQVQVTNSVVEAFGSGRYCFEAPSNAVVQADYNDLLVRSNAQIASISGVQYESLPQWVRTFAQDRHSLGTDPRFHDVDNGDFHLRSVAGRYQYGLGYTNDLADPEQPDYSPLIDMGSTKTSWSNEPTPNGGRRNIGLYGNTDQASMSDTNAWLKAVTGMSGGILSGGFKLIWGYGGDINPAALVQLEYSYDDGVNEWINIGAVAVGLGETYWQSDWLLPNGDPKYPSSPAGRWRLYLLDNTNVLDMTENNFGLNPPFSYYVNDAETNFDMYATAPGDDENPGFYPSVPKLTLQSLLQDRDIEPGDTIYVDTGVYYMADTNTPIIWEASDGGSNGLPVLVRGSTTNAGNGSRFVASNRFTAGYFFQLQASHMDMRDLYFTGESLELLGNGLVVSNLSMTNQPGLLVNLSLQARGNNFTFSDVQIDRGAFSLSGTDDRVERMRQRWGSTVLAGTNICLINSAIYATNLNAIGVDATVDLSVVSNCTVVASRGTALRKRGGGTLRSGHNILVAGGSDVNHVILWDDGNLLSDWNNLLARDSAWIGSRFGKWEKLAYWQIASGQDANSVSFETTNDFQNETGGDFHLNSVGGRWSPLLDRWDTDTVHSVLIDLGDPSSGTGFEEWFNGNRPNLGAYGRTRQASKSRTNMWVTALSHNDGGVLKGSNVVLRWAGPSGGLATSFRLEYSSDGGATWTNIATGLGLVQGYGTYVWNTAGFEDSFDGRWRVVAEDDSASDQTDASFALRNVPHAFYVNDADSTDDIYCSEIGSAANSGLSNSAPKLSLQQILDTYDLESGDVVYLDTGTYTTNVDTRIIWSRGGDTNGDVVIQGNTNSPYATVLVRSGAGSAIGIDVKASHIQLKNMQVRGTDRGIRLESNRNVTVEGVLVGEAATGLDVRGAQGVVVQNSGFWKNTVGVNLANTRTSVLKNLTFALPTGAGIQMQSTALDTLQNNIFIPDAGAYAYSIGDAVSLLSDATMDYNLYDFGRAGSGFYAGGTNYYSGPTNDPLRRWQVGKPQPGGFSGMNRDYRSAITNADLAEIEFEPLDFHPLSTNGRWSATATGGEWTSGDLVTSWAVDHGDPNQDYSEEIADNGNRINIGMYGNTAQASKGDTNAYLYARTMNWPSNRISQYDPVWPLVWSAHMLGTDEWVWVQFSGDGGDTWVNLTTNPILASTEYYVWTVTIDYSTGEGLWRVISATNPPIGDPIDEPFVVQFRDVGFLTSPRPLYGLMRCEWEGGIQGRRYEIRYSDDFGKTWILWDEKYNGPATINKSNFVIPAGGSQLSYTFEDRTSYLRRTRWYKIIQYEE